ncbi:radical SAM protein [Deferribacter thermophilus]|uniref:radical SAM protein n=1 Tax=Deferribacter thermophilus TaxID=53573 RepID=UPI003C13A167
MKYIFGPVPSRRLGASLGVNLVPKKICSLDCVYCEVGKTTEFEIERKRFFNPDELLSEFKIVYERKKDIIDVVTFTGAGEPTLNIDLAYLANEVKKIIDKPLAILTNGTLLFREDVRNELLNFDIVVPSVDAVSESIFKRVNRPHSELNIEKIIDGLKEFSRIFKGKLFIEILLVKGVNDNEVELKKIANVLKNINYTKVQLNTVFRPPAYKGFDGLNEKELLEKALFLAKEGVKVETVGAYLKSLSNKEEYIVEDLIDLLSMRPCTVNDLKLLFNRSDIVKILDKLIVDKKITKDIINNEIYFKVAK